VYKTDTPDEETTPAQAVAEPVKRETRKATAETADDVSDIVKKWTKK
jgi:hypothetical protein